MLEGGEEKLIKDVCGAGEVLFVAGKWKEKGKKKNYKNVPANFRRLDGDVTRDSL